MRPLRHFLAIALLALVVVPVATAASAGAGRRSVAIFFYPWYGNPDRDGDYEQWSQNGHAPPWDIYSAYFPQRGAYSSSDARLLDRQMAEIAGAGVDVVVSSWWGPGSPTDRRLPAVLRAARRNGLSVAVHLEPYGGRTAAGVAADIARLAALGVRDFYVYRPEEFAAAEWAALRPALPRVRLFGQTGKVGFAAAARFDGVYTYDIVTYDGDSFARLCNQAWQARLLCAPSVGPGYDAGRAGDVMHRKPRRHGQTYDAMWQAALDAGPDVVTITSYNEWGEGTQIEPARRARGYRSYDGAWGLHGPAAARAYLDRTAFWTARYHGGR
jgi:glycoprotein endo-alpha-1,2-mannosidase